VAVTESTTGTRPKAEGTNTPSVESGTPEKAGQVSPTYSQEEVARLIQEAKHSGRSEGGRDWQKLESEVNSLKDNLADITDEREELKARMEELASDDPDKFNLIKKEQDLRARERKYKTDLRDLERKGEAQAGTVKMAQDTLREISINDIASEYMGGDAMKLKDLCDTFSATSDDQIRKVADTLWEKGPQEPSAPPLRPYSGHTDGGKEPGPPTAKGKMRAGWDSLHP